MTAEIGQQAPNLNVSKWVQGLPTNFDKEKDNVVLVEVFQVNCPGCFMYGIPEAIDIYKKFHLNGVTVLGLATAFEDFDKNTIENLEKLLTTGEVIGDTYQTLSQSGDLDGNKLSYKIPFPVGMDSLITFGEITQDKMSEFIKKQIPDFDSQPEQYKKEMFERAREYMKAKKYTAETFENYALRGTPSSILVDRKGILQNVTFGQSGSLESSIKKLLDE